MVSMTDFSFLRQIDLDIERNGFHLVAINGPDSECLYCHSIGLYKLRQPELIFMNSSIEQAKSVLKTIVDQGESLPEMGPSMMLKVGSMVFSTTPITPSTTSKLLSRGESHYRLKNIASETKALCIVLQEN